MHKFVCLSGLPRSGSTLLSAILHQNPLIHAEGNSAVCQLMWDMEQSCKFNCGEQLQANNRHTTMYELVASIPVTYYKHVTRLIILDKCRSWTLPANQDLLQRFVTDTPKTIVLTRPIEEIVASFADLHKRNDKPFDESALLREGTEPLMRSLSGVESARKTNRGEFLFISYEELINDTNAVLDEIYHFICEKRFFHNLKNIINNNPENDLVYGLNGMHDVYPTIIKKKKTGII